MWLARTCTLWLIGIAAADVLWPPTERPPDVRIGGALVVLAVPLALGPRQRGAGVLPPGAGGGLRVRGGGPGAGTAASFLPPSRPTERAAIL